MAFQKATKQQAKLRLAIHGPSGAGKTRSALEIAKWLESGRIALIDTERGSASKYAHLYDFDTEQIADNYHPERLLRALNEAAAGGYGAVIVDSITHFWNGPGGFLELVDAEVTKMAAKGNKPDSFAAWKIVDPIYRRMIQAILACPFDVILTMRAKQEYVKEEAEKGKTRIRKVGLAPEMRDSFQYEADVEGMLDLEHNLVIGKTRCEELDGKVFHKPGREVATILRRWLSDGAPAPTQQAPEASVPKAESPASPSGEGSPDPAYEALAKHALQGIQQSASADEVRNLLAHAYTRVPQPLLSEVVIAGYLRIIEFANHHEAFERVQGEIRREIRRRRITLDLATARLRPALDERMASFSQAAF